MIADPMSKSSDIASGQFAIETGAFLECPTQCYPDTALCLMCRDDYLDMTTRQDRAIIPKAVSAVPKKG